jgi:hypothetical protein
MNRDPNYARRQGVFDRYDRTPRREPETLEEFHGLIARYVQLGEYRCWLARLYDGSPNQDWFLFELVGCMGSLCELEGGVQFVWQIHKRLQYIHACWREGLFSVIEHLVKCESGCLILCDIFTQGSADEQSMVARLVFSEFYNFNWSSRWFQDLFYECVYHRRNDFDLFQPLLLVNWLEKKQFTPLFCIFLQSMSDAMYDFISHSLLSDVDHYVRDPELHRIVLALIARGPQAVRDRIFNFLMTVSDADFKGDPIKSVLVRFAEEATQDQSEQMLARFAKTMQTSSWSLGDCDAVLAAILSVCPLKEQVRFIIFEQAAIRIASGWRMKKQLVAVESALQALKYEPMEQLAIAGE